MKTFHNHQPPTGPRPPTTPRPPTGPRPPTIPRPPTGPRPVTDFETLNDNVSYSDIMAHNALVNQRLPPRKPRPQIPIDNKKRPIDSTFSNISYAPGKRATWSVKFFEDREYEQPFYHEDKICGSGNDGLAGTIQQLINEGNLDDAIHQLELCIKARGETALDTTHKNIIPIYSDFLQELKHYKEDDELYQDVLRNGGFVVKFHNYTNPGYFTISQSRNLTYIDKNLDVLKKYAGSKKHKRVNKKYTKRIKHTKNKKHSVSVKRYRKRKM